MAAVLRQNFNGGQKQDTAGQEASFEH